MPAEQSAAARDFQLGVFFAQTIDRLAGRLDADRAKGGPVNLANQTFYVGINDIEGKDPMDLGLGGSEREDLAAFLGAL